jgi:hypothetical protein
MRTTRTLLISALAVFAISAVASASASAVEWKVKGVGLGTGERKIAEVAKIGVEPVANENVLKWNGIVVTCTGLTVKGGFIKGPAANGAEALTFSGCSVTTPAKCIVTGGSIKTEAVVSTLEAGPPVKVKFAPKTGENFTKFKLANKSETEVCSVKGEFTVHGTATGEVVKPGVEEVEKSLAFNKTSGSKLLVGEQPAEFITEVGLKLNPEELWTGD